MGSWNVHCQISKISISCIDEVVLILLKPNTYIDKDNYHFMCPPIYGTYDDYGRIEDIIENPATKILEEYYGEPIEIICDAITRESYCPDDVDYTSKILREEISSIKYMWVLRNIWDEFTKLHEDSCLYQSYEMGNTNLLKFLGLEFVKNDESLERFNRVWKFGNNIFYSDGRWLQTSDGYSCFYITDLEKFGINVDGLKGKSELNFVKTLFTKKLEPMFFNFRSESIEQNSFINNAKHSRAYEFFTPFMEDYRPTELMGIFHNHVLKNSDIDDEIIKLYIFRENCFNCSISIEPMKQTFTQFGEYKIHKHFVEIFSKELDNKIKLFENE